MTTDRLQVLIEPCSVPDPAQHYRRHRACHPRCAWLDSGAAHGLLGAWSFVTAPPFASIVWSSRGLWWHSPDHGPRRLEGDPFHVLERLLAPVAAAEPGWPPFIGGALALFPYELGHRLEPTIPWTQPAGECLLWLDLVRGLVAVHHDTGEAYRVACAWGGEHPETAAHETMEWLRQAATAPLPDLGRWHCDPPLPEDTRDVYGQKVEAGRQAIYRGDLFEVCLTQRWRAPFEGDPLAFYLALRQRNPAPFGAFWPLPFATICSASPERFLRLDHRGQAETRPIKGTRPRGATPAEDARLEQELTSSQKDRAENLMIVDLARNDLGRVCRPGTVAAPDLFSVETHPHVFQLVSTITGQLRGDRTRFDLIRAAFPPGSMTGAPKIAAMQHIDRVEASPRGIYSGALGYLDLRGGLDLSVIIRTATVLHGQVSLGSGGAVTWDSDPLAEVAEAEQKIRVLAEVLTGDST